MEQNKTFNAPEIKLHFLDYWRIIRIRKTVILAVFLLVAITTTLVTFILPESYSSMARISVEKDMPDIDPIGGRAIAPGFDPYFIQTEFEKIQSKSVLHQVITNLDLNHKWAEKYKEAGALKTEVTYQILKKMIEVSQSRNTSLIEIKAYSEDKDEAAMIANEIAKVYRDYRLNTRMDMTLRGIDKLKQELEAQNMVVSNKQAEVDKWKAELRINDSEAMGTGPATTLEPETVRRLEQMRLEALAQYSQMKTLYEGAKALSPKEFREAALSLTSDMNLADLVQRQNQTQQELARLSVELGPENPDLLKLQRLLEKINSQVSDRLEGIMTGFKVQTEQMKAKLDTLDNAKEAAAQEDIEKATQRRPYFTAKRDLENQQLIRDVLSRRIYQETIDAKIPKSGVVEIIDSAEPAFRAVRPNKPLNIALGIIVGLAVGVGLAFFIEYLDTSVKTIDDVERALQAPVLGVIPQNVGSLLDEGPDSPHAEAYRVLRTNVLFSRKDQKLNTMTIVSGGAGEGKSTTLFNLATVFAQNGQRVLIVDSDLRRPSIHKFLHLSNSIGLTNYLLKQNSLEEVIQTTGLPTLDFMPSGKLPSSSMGILSSVQMKELIREIKRRYDFVFFDSPPIMGVSDASILASEVDLVLQVIQYRRYPQPMTIRAKQMIEKVGGNLLGIVLNNINMAQDENYYYYSGYYYDYYSKYKDEPEKETASPGKKQGQEVAKVEIKPKY